MPERFQRSVFKYSIPFMDALGKVATIELPKNAKPLHVDIQHGMSGSISFWYEVSIVDGLESVILEPKKIILYMTGQYFETNHSHPLQTVDYIKTFFLGHGFVVHLYEVRDYGRLDPK